MIDTIIITSYFFFWYLLVFVSCAFLLSAIDDLFIDFFFLFYGLRRRYKYKKMPQLTYEKLAALREKRVAIMVACWQEHNVIGVMLKHNTLSIDYKNYTIFVGLYPNDPATIEEVQAAALENPEHIHAIVGEKAGPSNKAENLNTIYNYIKDYESLQNITFDVYVFHDSEDIIHPLSIKLYNYLINKSDMIQIPVFPLPVPLRKFTHWVYADEFAENHTKNMIFREYINGFVPSAGVGTAFSSPLLCFLSEKNEGSPFSTSSLTEDYRTSLTINRYNFKQIFVTHTIKITQWQKKYLFFGSYIQKKKTQRIATQEMFPEKYTKSVIQKSRWIIGIALQEWQNSHWKGSLITKLLLVHDRKALITHLINGLGYIVFIYWVLYSLLTRDLPQFPSLQESLDHHPFIWWFMLIATIVMVERLCQRTFAVKKVYGLLPALLVIPRAIYGNIINLHAMIRAYRMFFFVPIKTESKRKWDKTEHHFPGEHILIPYKKRLGDILIEEKLIDEKTLSTIINEHQQSGIRLGEILITKKIISLDKLNAILAQQYKIQLISAEEVRQSQALSEKLPKKTQRFFSKNGILLVSLSLNENKITIAITDPTNQSLIREIKKRFPNMKIHFKLLG